MWNLKSVWLKYVENLNDIFEVCDLSLTIFAHIFYIALMHFWRNYLVYSKQGKLFKMQCNAVNV